MTLNLTSDSINHMLICKQYQVLCEAILKLNTHETSMLFEELVKLTDHRLPAVRAAALRALQHTDPACLVEVIRHCLRDENKQVRIAAAELFHLNKIAA